MDDLRFGGAIRAARVRRGWRQADLARQAGVGATTVARIERGRLDGVPVGTLRKVAQVLEIRVELLPRSRAADLDRILNARHAALAEEVIAWFAQLGGWLVRPDVSF
jgi:transcriptional regulator with XRE-family HTH domain